jgi:hypothetical protein
MSVFLRLIQEIEQFPDEMHTMRVSPQVHPEEIRPAGEAFDQRASAPRG